MVREELVNSAVAFLQDASVASSTPDQRTSFLRSKNLTQEEIDLSLARAANASSSSPVPATTSLQPSSPPNYGSRNRYAGGGYPGTGYDYGPYQGGGFWGMPPPDPPPHRDWRDWFIMATVSSGFSYGLYVFAKRYIFPLISPPTPSQLAADKAAIDESFSRAFTLIDQLATDTADLKSAEVDRTEKLDSTLRDVESVIRDLKTANARREAESRILADQVHGLRDLVPKALDGWKAAEDKKLEDLGVELRSLKLLVANRFGIASSSQSAAAATTSTSRFSPSSSKKPLSNPDSTTTTPPTASAPSSNPIPTTTEDNTSRPESAALKGRFQAGGRVAAIPAWQMANAGGGGGGGGGGSSGGNGGGNGVGAGLGAARAAGAASLRALSPEEAGDGGGGIEGSEKGKAREDEDERERSEIEL